MIVKSPFISRFYPLDLGLGKLGVAGASAVTTDFVMVMATTAPAETVTIPCQNVGTFNAEIDWGDDSTSTITAYNDADLAHEYASTGDHVIRISGTFPNLCFNNGGDCLKVKEVRNLGVVGWSSLNCAFYGCTNLTLFVAGNTDTSSVTNMGTMLRGCSGLIDPPDFTGMDTSSVTGFSGFMRDCTNMTSPPDFSGFDTSNVIYANTMLRGWSSVGEVGDIGISGWDIESVTTFASFALGVTFSTAAYDAILIAWDAQNPVDSVTAHFGNSTYTSGGAAEAARTSLITGDLWSITD